MITVRKDTKTVEVYWVADGDFPYEKFNNVEPTLKKGAKEYYDLRVAFDIETTNMEKNKWAFMYVWQMGFYEQNCVAMGRTWNEFNVFIEGLRKKLNKGHLPVYVHNLQFEFQFMRNFCTMQEVFSRKKRQVVRCRADNWLELRCSYILTNMSLDKFTNKVDGVHWKKESGEDFNYNKIRWPDTKLTEKEILYCVCDVMGLCEAIDIYVRKMGYTLANVPMTSTGFVRNDYREVCINDKAHMSRFRRGKVNAEQYTLLSEASRGGIAGSNSVFTGWNISGVDSEDIKSSYPYQMCTKYFPVGGFSNVNVRFGDDRFYDLLATKCCLIVWYCEDIKLKDWNTIPYISKSNCSNVVGAKVGNGKLYEAELCGMCCTEIDMKLINRYYTYKNPVVVQMLVADRGMLSRAFRGHLMEMFFNKTMLEDGDPFDYNKYKNKINASFGMLLTDIVQPEVVYRGLVGKDVFIREVVKDVQSGLDTYYSKRSSFLNYQDGVWVLAHGRDDLCTGWDIVGSDVVQVDTDSVKHVNDYKKEFEELNAGIIEACKGLSVKPWVLNKKGEMVHLGVWEHERLKGERGNGSYTYKTFRTLGAKKYCYTDWTDESSMVVSGVPKEEGTAWINKNGLKAFKPGSTINSNESGRLVAFYNDFVRPVTKCIKGHWVTYGSNICLLPGTYTFGVTEDWDSMLTSDVDWKIEDDNTGV